MAKGKKGDPATIIENRKARHDYEILDRFEAGVELVGSEVKSLRAAQAQFADAFAAIDGGQVWLHGVRIAEYPQASRNNHDPDRRRRLLLNRYEIERLRGKLKEQGLTLVPLRFYFKGPRIKLELGLARGKKTHDKRQALREKADKREMRNG